MNNSYDIMQKIIVKFICNVIEKFKDEKNVINIILDYINQRYSKYLKIFNFNQINLKSQDQYQSNEKFINNDIILLKENKNQNDNINSNVIQNSIDKIELNSDSIIEKDINKINQFNNNNQFYTPAMVNKIKEIFNLSNHRNTDQFRNVENIVYPDIQFENYIDYEKEFVQSNQSNSSLIFNVHQMTLFFFNQTKYIYINTDEKIENKFYQQDIDYIINSGLMDQFVKIYSVKIQTFQYKQFSEKYNTLYQKILTNFLKYCNIIFDDRQQFNTSTLNTVFKIVEIPLTTCNIYAIAIKDMKIFTMFLNQNQCVQSKIEQFYEMQAENPFSMYVQNILLNYFRQLLKQKINVKLFYQHDKEHLQKHILHNQVLRHRCSGTNQNFRDVIIYHQFIGYEFKLKCISVTQNDKKYKDNFFRFLEHVKNADLIQSVDKNEITKIRDKFLRENNNINIQGVDLGQYAEMYKKIFGKIKILREGIEQEYLDSSNLINSLRNDINEMKNLNQLFMPGCFHMRQNSGTSFIRLQGGFKIQTERIIGRNKSIFQFNQTDKYQKFQFKKIFNKFYLNAYFSNQFKKEELLEIKEILKTVDHLNDSCIILVSFYEVRPDQFRKLSNQSKYLSIIPNNYIRYKDDSIKKIN